MLPTLRQRGLMTLAVVIGVFPLMWASGALRTADLGPGLSLLHARTGLVVALLTLIFAGVPAVVMGIVASGAANPLAGVFTVVFSLGIIAASGGAIDGLLWRAESPAVYGGLAFESLIWMALAVCLLTLIAKSRLWVRRRFPRLVAQHHHGLAVRMKLPGFDTLLAGLISASVGGLVAWVVLKSTDSQQVFGALLLAFTLGGLVAQQVVPHHNPVGILLSPLLVAIVSYLYTWMVYSSADAMLASWHVGELPSLARALPIHYASAAIAGCAIGIGMAQGLEHAKHAAASAGTDAN